MLLSSTAAFHLPKRVFLPLSYSLFDAPGGEPISVSESLPKLQMTGFDGSNCVPLCGAIPKHLMEMGEIGVVNVLVSVLVCVCVCQAKKNYIF